jgi:hypothetical protein
MVPLGGLSEKKMILFQLLFIGERDAGHTLDGLIFVVAKPIC